MTRPHPPAWYPDPRDRSRLRRWDGRVWTDEVRPLPDWLRTLRLAPGPRRRPANRMLRRLWVASGACLAVALVLLDVVGDDVASAERISDRRFLAAASAACWRTEHVFVEPHRHPLKGAAEVERLEQLVVAQEALVTELRSIDVATADQDTVDRWLASWDSWTTAGHRYAQAVAEDDTTRARDISARSRHDKSEIDAFAITNGIPSCVLFQTG